MRRHSLLLVTVTSQKIPAELLRKGLFLQHRADTQYPVRIFHLEGESSRGNAKGIELFPNQWIKFDAEDDPQDEFWLRLDGTGTEGVAMCEWFNEGRRL